MNEAMDIFQDEINYPMNKTSRDLTADNINTVTKAELAHVNSWDRFLELVKQEDAVKDYPRRNVFIDADLHKTLMELDFGNCKVNHILNSILRSFLESHIESLVPFRKSFIRSIFDSTPSHA